MKILLLLPLILCGCVTTQHKPSPAPIKTYNHDLKAPGLQHDINKKYNGDVVYPSFIVGMV